MKNKRSLRSIAGLTHKPKHKALREQWLLWQQEFLRPAPWFSSAELFIVALQRCFRTFGRVVGRFSVLSSLSDLEYHVLWCLEFDRQLSANRQVTITLLARIVGAANANVISIVLKRLEKRRLISRPSEGKHTRGRRIVVTPTGRRLIHDAFTVFMDEAPKFASEYCGFSPREEQKMAQFLATMFSIMKGMDRYVEDMERLSATRCAGNWTLKENAQWTPEFLVWPEERPRMPKRRR